MITAEITHNKLENSWRFRTTQPTGTSATRQSGATATHRSFLRRIVVPAWTRLARIVGRHVGIVTWWSLVLVRRGAVRRVHVMMHVLERQQTSPMRGTKSDEEKGKLGAYAMKRVAAGAHLPTPWLFEPTKRPDDRADYCLDD